MRKIVWFIFCLCSLLVGARAETYQLLDGTSVSGDVVSFNDIGAVFRGEDDKYTSRISWTKFSQDALNKLAENPKIKPLVEPFIEIPESQRPQKPEVKIHDVTRLELPPKQSLFSALFSSSVGLVALLLIYAGNLYAGYEVAVCRARPIAAVMGLAAVLPIIGPIVFLSMPIKAETPPTEEEVVAEPQTFITAGVAQAQQETAAAEAAGGLHISHGGAPAAGAHPEPQIFKRGQFTFNRRFIETKFANFFGTTRRGADKDMVLVVKTPRDTYLVERITRIAANDVHFETIQGTARPEVMVAFTDIQEMQLKHKDA